MSRELAAAKAALESTRNETIDECAMICERLRLEYPNDTSYQDACEAWQLIASMQYARSKRHYRKGRAMNEIKKISVPFQISIAVGFRTYNVRCIDAPTLTASGAAIKIAADIPMNYALHFYDKKGQVLDAEACVLNADGSTRFIAVPPAHY